MGDEMRERWICENPGCRAEYAEYVNGCPKCYQQNLLHFSVRMAKAAEVIERGALGDGTHRMTDDGLRVLGTQDACKEAALESGGKHER